MGTCNGGGKWANQAHMDSVNKVNWRTTPRNCFTQRSRGGRGTSGHHFLLFSVRDGEAMLLPSTECQWWRRLKLVGNMGVLVGAWWNEPGGAEFSLLQSSHLLFRNHGLAAPPCTPWSAKKDFHFGSWWPGKDGTTGLWGHSDKNGEHAGTHAAASLSREPDNVKPMWHWDASSCHLHERRHHE